MGGVDEMRDPFRAQVGNEPRNPAEAADPHRNGLRPRRRRAPRIGEGGPLAARRKRLGEAARLGRAAEDEDVASHG